jgi:PAS domain S-box-containing protein
LPWLELQRAVIEAVPAGVAVVDRDLRFLLINEQGASFDGVSIADHIGRRVSDVIPHVFPVIEPIVLQVIETAQPAHPAAFQAETAAMPGVLRWWETEYRPLFDADGEVVAICATFTDATEKIAAQDALVSTMQKMRTILDILPVGLAIAHDTACENVELNEAYRRMMHMPAGTSHREWNTRSQSLRFLLNGEEIGLWDRPLHKAASRGEATDAGRVDIYAEDRSRQLLAYAAPLLIDGVLRGAVAAYIDITDMVRVEQQLRTANAVQHDFLAMVSHELRTPMTMILGNSQLLSRREGKFSEDDRQSLAAEVFGEAVNLGRIVDNLLLMTRIDREGRLELEPLVLRHACNKVINELPEGAGRCRCYCPIDQPVVLANATSVEQVMRNLISNALKYSPANRKVDIGMEVAEGQVVFSVADRGPGIDTSERERVFEPFFRSSSTSTRSGMGIGLAVSKRLVEAMGGKIWAAAREGGGSVFSFSLPSVEVEVA